MITKTATFKLTVFSVPDFNLELPMKEGSIYAGKSVGIQVNVSAVDQFAGEINLSVSGYPAGSTVTFSPSSKLTISPISPRDAVIEIAVPANNALVGAYDIEVKAESTVYNGQ